MTAADFDRIPYLVVKGDHANASAPCQETIGAIDKRRAEKQGTATAAYLKLDDRGMLGATHMMMLDSKNLEMADLTLDWAAKNVEKAPRRR